MANLLSEPLAGTNNVNPMGAAFDSRTAVLEQKRKQEQEQKDNDFHTVVKYASEGLTNEARYYAQQKGLSVPDEVYRNADFASALSTAKDLYDDPIAAQKYATAYMSVQGDRLAKYNAGLAAAGKPIGKDERELNLYARKLAIQQRYSGGGGSDKGFTLSAGQTRYDANGNPVATAQDTGGEYEAYSKAYNAAISSGLMTQEDADNAGKKAVEQYRAMRPQQQSYGSQQSHGGVFDDSSLSNLPQLEIGADGKLIVSQSSVPIAGQPLANNPNNPPNRPMQMPLPSQAVSGNQMVVAKTPDGGIVSIPESEIDDAMSKGLEIVGWLNQPQAEKVNNGQAVIPRTPQQIVRPAEEYRPPESVYDYYDFKQGATPAQNLMTIGANITNVPAHLKNIGAGAVNLTNKVNPIKAAERLLDEDIIPYMTTPTEIPVYDNSGKMFYVKRENLEQAQQMGYSLQNPNAGPMPPIAQ